MTDQLSQVCEIHADPADCADALACYLPKFDEYGLWIHDGGSSFMAIRFCPWCGTKLPASRRDEWFEKLTGLGYDNPLYEDIPNAFTTDAWYRGA